MEEWQELRIYHSNKFFAKKWRFVSKTDAPFKLFSKGKGLVHIPFAQTFRNQG